MVSVVITVEASVTVIAASATITAAVLVTAAGWEVTIGEIAAGSVEAAQTRWEAEISAALQAGPAGLVEAQAVSIGAAQDQAAVVAHRVLEVREVVAASAGAVVVAAAAAVAVAAAAEEDDDKTGGEL
jgi:hypothetical protein